MPHARLALLGATLFLCAHLAGCASYITPGRAANLYRAAGIASEEGEEPYVEYDIAKQLDTRPGAEFPATLALLRIQDVGYRSHSTRGVDRGAYSIVTVRDVEKEEDLERLHAMPMVRSVVPLNKMVVGEIGTERDLRAAAARVHADALVLYTFDTQFDTDTTIPALGVITLGLFPNEEAKVTSTASAVVVDVRTGYVYALAESTSDTKQLANAWTSQDAIDQSRRRAERRAFEGLVVELESAWGRVVTEHARTPRGAAPRAGGDGAGWIEEAHSRE